MVVVVVVVKGDTCLFLGEAVMGTSDNKSQEESLDSYIFTSAREFTKILEEAKC
jgi:hypothetical protein